MLQLIANWLEKQTKKLLCRRRVVITKDLIFFLFRASRLFGAYGRSRIKYEKGALHQAVKQ